MAPCLLLLTLTLLSAAGKNLPEESGVLPPEVDEVLELNVGGEVFHTLRSTLLASGSHVLANIFSGRWRLNWGKDAEDRVFLDFDPDAFRLFLSYLRLRRHVVNAKAPQVPRAMSQAFEAMVSYLSAEEVLDGLAPAEAWQPDPKALVLQGNQDVTVEGTKVRVYSLDVEVVTAAVPLLGNDGRELCWTLRIRRFWKIGKGYNVPEDFVAGVMSDDFKAYGWDAGPWTYQAGQSHRQMEGWTGWQPGDVGIFKIDAEKEQLSMYNRREGKRYVISLKEGVVQQARLFLNLSGLGFEVELGDASDAEKVQAGF